LKSGIVTYGLEDDAYVSSPVDGLNEISAEEVVERKKTCANRTIDSFLEDGTPTQQTVPECNIADTIVKVLRYDGMKDRSFASGSTIGIYLSAGI